MIPSINVTLWGKTVGTLVESGSGRNRQICFYFNPGFVRSGLDIAPLRGSIYSVVAQKGLPIYPEKDRAFCGLPSFIADSIPDTWGQLVFRQWAKSHNISMKNITALDRLAYIGRRGMGALEFEPPTSDGLETSFKVEINQLSELAQTMLRNARDFKAQLSPDLLVESLFKVGTSAGGRRPKALVNVNIESGECYSGQVVTELPGFTPMIIKFDEHTDLPTTRIEYAYYLMARQAGLRMMPSRLLEGDGVVHFLTERFDRRGGEKLHVQTLAALDPDSRSYEDLFAVAHRLHLPQEDMKQLLLQTALNFMAGNVDDHNKNFSFIMDREGTWRVAPAYDFTFTVDPSAPSYVNRHCMTLNGKDDDVSDKDLLELAVSYDITGGRKILEAARGAVENFAQHAATAGLPTQVTDLIIQSALR
ncbi:MAG: type II toxin-antitoxin system HipA family toxin [Muribaculaceae bacterium]|nr:type II toxin-antitoxin system HipA family toxin [Muribaculaceae bacterium]